MQALEKMLGHYVKMEVCTLTKMLKLTLNKKEKM